ncbi:hypothetical protein SEUCBS139899_001603 [Sporothrix eucalyptigena]|uniref:Pyridoxamine 5'-phosphate oxidase N-terminal domain-containing protein n=1 Tax=Sporothrix eucalyptigena TaxID=1812306 RepID=A0ABP0BMW9_9PEZI
MEQIPLNHQASDGETNKQSTTCLPTEVVQCLENARFLHLATCVDNVPHVSLMNYTYLPSAAGAPDHPIAAPVIVMTSNPASKKTHNIVANPNVSLLVHDWVSHRPLHRRMSAGSALSEDGPGGEAAASGALSGVLGSLGAGNGPSAEHPPSSLATLLLNLNTAAVSSISATINGTARLLTLGSAEEAYYHQQHLAYNTFDADPVGPDERRIHSQIAHAGQRTAAAAPVSGTDPRPQDGRERFVAGEEVRVIVVAIRDVRISDWKGQVRDWVLEPAAASQTTAAQPNINGI